MRPGSVHLLLICSAVLALALALSALVVPIRPALPARTTEGETTATADRGYVQSTSGLVALTAERDRHFGEAKVTGTVIVLDGGCLGLDRGNGIGVLVLWPHGTVFRDEELDVPGMGRLQVGSYLDGGGGHGQLRDPAHPSCAAGPVSVLSTR